MPLTKEEIKFLGDLYQWALDNKLNFKLYTGEHEGEPYFEADILYHDTVWKHNVFEADTLKDLKVKMKPRMNREEVDDGDLL